MLAHSMRCSGPAHKSAGGTRVVRSPARCSGCGCPGDTRVAVVAIQEAPSPRRPRLRLGPTPAPTGRRTPVSAASHTLARTRRAVWWAGGQRVCGCPQCRTNVPYESRLPHPPHAPTPILYAHTARDTALHQFDPRVWKTRGATHSCVFSLCGNGGDRHQHEASSPSPGC